ncbi:MAG: OmpA family protein [Cyclobacteriaceae bacterium]|nr:OmpA family protein [Cyclobacteriaceae bacterium]
MHLFKSYLTVLGIIATTIVGYSQEIQWASKVIEFSSELTPIQYSADQVLGKPNVLPAAGESPSAWTPDRPNSKEFLKVGFETPIQIRQIVIAESYSPTAITSIYAYDVSGKEHLINTFSASSIPLKGRLFSIIMNETPYKVAAVKVEFDGSTVPEYYSVDAIGISASGKPTNVEVEIMENLNTNLLAERLSNNVNSPYTEYKPLLSPDGRTLYFSRKNHPENIGGIEDDEDIWYSEMDSTGEWQEAVNIGRPLNNESPNYVCSVTPDGNSVVMLLGNQYDEKGKDKMRAGVSISSKEGDKWTKPFNLIIENDYNYNEKANYFLANNRQVLLLSVERDDSNGARDLYVSFFKEDSTWTEPLNLGKTLNTAGDEASPFLAADDKTLYFSSNGLRGYGGQDIYVSTRLDDTWTNWSDPLNLGPDINSDKEDLFFNIPLTGNYAYYTQEVGEDNSDIFKVELPLRVMPSDVIVIRGRLLDKETGEPIEAKIIYEKLPEGTTAGITKSHKGTGNYEIVLPKGYKYGYRAEVEGYLPINENIDLTDNDEVASGEVSADMYMVPEKVAAVITLNNIFFDFDKSILKPASFPELDRLAEYLAKSATVKIEIRGYTDSTGPEAYNMGLSQRRANAVYKYLLDKNIAANRLSVKWFGENNPAESNATVVGRRANRRVEFEILEK